MEEEEGCRGNRAREETTSAMTATERMRKRLKRGEGGPRGRDARGERGTRGSTAALLANKVEVRAASDDD